MAEGLVLDNIVGDIPPDQLDQLCSDDHLLRLSQSLDYWPIISPFLGLTPAEEAEVKGEEDVRQQRVNMLQKWKSNEKDRATYRSLIEALCRAQRLDLADIMVDLLQAQAASQVVSTPCHTPQHSPTPCLDQPNPLPRPCPLPRGHRSSADLPRPLPAVPSASRGPFRGSPSLSPAQTLTEYGHYLKERYERQVANLSVQWPPSPTQRACNLAMIRQARVQRGELSDAYVRMAVGGKVEDILHVKVAVKLEHIFEVDRARQKVILIEGAPGSGKSTLSWDICRRWGSGELFQEYELVVLVQLRDPEVQAASTIADILPAPDQAMADSVARQVKAMRGSKVLLVLDGWDELPRALQKKSLFRSLISPPLQDDALSECSVIVTSRPISSQVLHPLVSSRVEIVGFTQEELLQYFSECLGGDSQAVAALMERVEENPVVASSCYLPLNAAIIVHLFLSGNHNLPNTVHGIFTSLIMCCLSRYQREKLGLEGEAANLESLTNLPDGLQESFRQLCALAFSGVLEDRVSFSSAHLEALGVQTDASALGLLQAVPSIVSHKTTVYYNFLHLSIQELLAAYHISATSASEQIVLFKRLFDQSRFAAVFQFYAGITRFQSKTKYLSKFAFLLPTKLFPTGIYDVVATMARPYHKQLVVSLINCLFEARDLSLCQFVAKQLGGGVNLHGISLSTLDCLSLGFFLSCVCATMGKFNGYLRNCSIDDKCCKFLVKGLSMHQVSGTGLLDVNLGDNRIHEEGARHLALILKNSAIVWRLSLWGIHGNHRIGEAGIKFLAQALISNSSLLELKLYDCAVKITEDNGPVFREMLHKNTALQALHLSWNEQVTDTGAFFLAEGLKQNSSLRVLYLGRCGITDEGVKSLGKALLVNGTLKWLWLGGNTAITQEGLTVLTDCLKVNRGLVELELPKHLKPFRVSEAVNAARKQNHSPTITISYSAF